MLRAILVGALLVSAFGNRPALGKPEQPAPPAHQTPATDASQRWKGAIELPQGSTLEFAVRLFPATGDAPASGTMDIPMQGLKEGALSDVVVGDQLKFTLRIPGMPDTAAAVFTCTPSADGKTATGELHQSGLVMPVKMERIGEGERIEPARPQEPKPPFPYEQREVTYSNARDGTKLAGTLTLPENAKGAPAVVMITGSGAQDRDESLLGHKPFLVIADYLTRHGIGVLRADDRGVGGSGGNVMLATPEDSAGDVRAALEFLKSVPEIDASRLGLIGHSEGGIIAPMVAAESPDVSFVVLLAGTGIKGRDILTSQSEAMMRAAGADETVIADATERHRHLMDLLEKDADAADLEAAIRELSAAQRRASPGAPEPSEDTTRALIAQQMAMLGTPWFRSFLSLDPRVALRKVTVPVLALNGTLDRQVPAQENLGEIEKALKEAGNADVTVRPMPGLNHLFQHAKSGNPDEYYAIEETFAPEALKVMTDWILTHTRASR